MGTANGQPGFLFRRRSARPRGGNLMGPDSPALGGRFLHRVPSPLCPPLHLLSPPRCSHWLSLDFLGAPSVADTGTAESTEELRSKE